MIVRRLILTQDNFNQALEQYLRSLSLINDDEFVISAAHTNTDHPYVDLQKE